MSESKGKRLWGGRFGQGPHEFMERINASISVDKRLYVQDVRGSQAHAAMLARQGILGSEDAEKIIAGLEQVRAEIEAGQMQWSDSLEDIHTHVEMRLKEIIGDARRTTAHRPFAQRPGGYRPAPVGHGRLPGDRWGTLLNFQRALVGRAEEHLGVIMPGYTHLQRAQPVLLSHHLLAYVEMAWRDRARLADCLGRASVLPLGGGGPGRHQFRPGPGIGGRRAWLWRSFPQLPGRGDATGISRPSSSSPWAWCKCTLAAYGRRAGAVGPPWSSVSSP